MKSIKTILILGGGTAGWMAAVSLSQFLKKRDVKILLVESAEIGTIGVGEATLPGLKDFNLSLGIDETDFIKKTQATFKLGIEFNDWKSKGSKFFHPFSKYGSHLNGIEFYQVWYSLFKNKKTSELKYFSLPSVMANHNKFAQGNPNSQSPLAQYHYAYHFDAALYATYLRQIAEKSGVIRIEDKLAQTNLDAQGYIESVSLEKSGTIAADFFIDCSGLRALLIEGALQTGFDDWSHWLPVNSAWAVQSQSTLAPTPFTKTTAREAGWQWRIPLQHRVGNGYVFCNQFISDDDAQNKLLELIDGNLKTQPRLIKFTTGRRKKFWNKNCVALGLASGFLEPLESTSISLIQTGISKLLMFFPDTDINQADADEANRLAQIEMERIRDFILLHYKLSQRQDSEFWRYIQTIQLPETLERKINIFKHRGHLINYEGESFGDSSWISMYNGFDILPQTSDLKTDHLDQARTQAQLKGMIDAIESACQQALSHQEFIKRFCAAEPLE